MHSACGQMRYLGTALMQAVAAIKHYNKADGEAYDREDWEIYMYGEINDAIHWMCRLETDILEVGNELRLRIKQRSDRAQAANAAAEERKWAKRDLVEYGLHLVEIERQGESADGAADGRRSASGSIGEGGAGSGGAAAAEADEALD